MADPKLRQIESWFWRSIAGEPGEYEFEPELAATIEPSRTLEPAGRLEIYAGAYFLRLRDVLAEDFPRVAKLTGEENFDRLVRQYLKAHPSTEPSVRHLGCRLADFVRDRGEVPAWLGDLAALEWARVNAFDAPDDEPLTMRQLAEIDPETWPQVRMAAVRSLAVVNAAWPVHRLWAEDDPEGLEPGPISIRVWRRADFHVAHAPMDQHEAAAVTRLLAGSTFGEICQVFDDLDQQQGAEQAGALLLRWLEDGLIAPAH
ncbi:MAG TPA: DNA-binding domain-containing protein [Candidatus Binataceae bacterium]